MPTIDNGYISSWIFQVIPLIGLSKRVLRKKKVGFNSSVDIRINMGDDIEEIFTKGGIAVVLLFAGFIWYPSILKSAENPNASANIISDGIVLLVYSAFPVSPLAVYVDLAVAVISSFVAASSLNARRKGIIFAAGAGWVLANMVMTAMNPPV